MKSFRVMTFNRAALSFLSKISVSDGSFHQKREPKEGAKVNPTLARWPLKFNEKERPTSSTVTKIRVKYGQAKTYPCKNLVIHTLRKAKAKFYINIREYQWKWKNCVNRLKGRFNNKNNNTLELKMNSVLVKDPLTLASALYACFINSVTEITQLFKTVYAHTMSYPK